MIAAGTGTILILSFRFFETDDGISVLSARGRWGEASPLIRIRVDRTDRGGGQVLLAENVSLLIGME